MAAYRIRMDDNRRLESRGPEHGSYASEAEAVAAAHELVEASLVQLHRPGMTADELLEAYFGFGQYPAIVPPPGAPHISFSAWDHAAQRAAAFCAEREVSA